MNAKPFNFTKLPVDAINRFSAKLQPLDNGCLQWTGCLLNSGYGMVTIMKHQYIASRIAWFIDSGIDPFPLFVLHKCDNRFCCNPAHLFLGNNKENIRDASIKGRKARKLSVESVNEIRKLVAEKKMSQMAIAKQFGICQGTIQGILSGKSWKHA